MAKYLYQQVAETLTAQIDSGNLRPGDRCPSVRAVRSQFSVSLSTAVQALELLETRGLIEARPQSGFYIKARITSSSMLRAQTSAAQAKISPRRVETAELISDVVASTRDPLAVPLGAASIGADLLPGPALYKSFLSVMRELGPDGLSYELPPGNEDLRRLIALRALTAGIEASAADVIITTGSMEAINLCLRAVTQPGDTVAIESPMFYGIMELIGSLGLKAAEIPCHPVTGMDLDCLERTLAARKISACLAIPNFNNPLGSKMPDDAKAKLVGLLARHDIPLIEDDIYGDLQHDGERPLAAKSFDKDGRVMLCSSFSKTLSPGLRVGWALPGRYFAKVEKLKFVNTIATATLPQAAVAAFLDRGGYDKYLRRLRGELCTRLSQYAFAVQKYFPPGTRLSQPTGGFVLWVQLPGEASALRLYEMARARGISFVPGPAFSTELGRFASCLRLTCGTPLSAPMDRALRALGEDAASLVATQPS